MYVCVFVCMYVLACTTSRPIETNVDSAIFEGEEVSRTDRYLETWWGG